MPTGEATITSRRPPILERSTDQTYPMSNNDNWPTRSRAGTLIRMKDADSHHISSMAKSFGMSIQRMSYMICIIVSASLDELPAKLMDYPIRFTEDSYITPAQLTMEELLKEKASIEGRIRALENQLRIYHSELEFRFVTHPATLFEVGVDQWISNHKQFAEELFLRHCSASE